MREKYNYIQQVRYLKDNGVKFNIVNENQALDFLSHNTYLFKLKAYTKNYLKDQDGKYIDLEFVYFKELSILYMYVRQIVLKLSLDFEHCLKTMLIHDVTKNLDKMILLFVI